MYKYVQNSSGTTSRRRVVSLQSFEHFMASFLWFLRVQTMKNCGRFVFYKSKVWLTMCDDPSCLFILSIQVRTTGPIDILTHQPVQVTEKCSLLSLVIIIIITTTIVNYYLVLFKPLFLHHWILLEVLLLWLSFNFCSF